MVYTVCVHVCSNSHFSLLTVLPCLHHLRSIPLVQVTTLRNIMGLTMNTHIAAVWVISATHTSCPLELPHSRLPVYGVVVGMHARQLQVELKANHQIFTRQALVQDLWVVFMKMHAEKRLTHWSYVDTYVVLLHGSKHVHYSEHVTWLMPDMFSNMFVLQK